MEKHTNKKSPVFNSQTGFILALVAGLLLVFVINHFSRKGIEGLIKSEEEVVHYFDLTNKIRKLHLVFLEADIHYHNYLVFEKKENLDLTRQDLITAKALFFDFEKSENFSSKSFNTTIQLLIQKFKNDGKAILEIYGKQFSRDTISETEYEKIELLRDSMEVTLDDLESYLQQILVPQLEEKRRYGNWVILIDMLSFFLTFLIVLTVIWLYFNYVGQQKVLRQKLELANQETEKTAFLKEQFLTNTSHEIRTPQKAILGFTNLLKKENLSPKQQELISGIDTSGSSLLQIINDILDFSKLDAGMMPLQFDPFSPGDLVQSVVQMLQPQVAKKNIELNFFLGKNLPKVVVGDSIRLTQVLVNLISNAIKFTNHGKVEVHAHFIRQENDFCRLGFRIMDTGVGISEEKQKLIFERFVQGDAELARGKGGTGLGLAIVKKIIDLQHGKILLTSKEGEGSTFYFEVPYRISDQAPVNKKIKPQVLPLHLPQGIKLLVVEDNPMNRRVIELLFEVWKIDFEFAENGKVAIEKATQQKYDLILMDIQLPEMDGYEVTRYLRDTLQLDTPIIAMTAHAMAAEKDKCIAAGMNGYLSKPFEEEKLIQLILNFTDTRQNLNPAESLLDMEYLQDISRGKPERIQELARIFIQQVPMEILAIEDAISNNDFTKIKSAAHNMKTTVGFMGLKNSLGKILNEMEETPESDQRMEQLKKLFLLLKKRTETATLEIKKSFLQ